MDDGIPSLVESRRSVTACLWVCAVIFCLSLISLLVTDGEMFSCEGRGKPRAITKWSPIEN